MGEAILYAIDAPEVLDLDAAAALVDNNDAKGDAPTANVAAFFAELMKTWPEDGSNGAVWYEEVMEEQARGRVVEMTFDLSEFTGETLGVLRSLAARHALHIFDPEGEVIYLSDGSEISRYE